MVSLGRRHLANVTYTQEQRLLRLQNTLRGNSLRLAILPRPLTDTRERNHGLSRRFCELLPQERSDEIDAIQNTPACPHFTRGTISSGFLPPARVLPLDGREELAQQWQYSERASRDFAVQCPRGGDRQDTGADREDVRAGGERGGYEGLDGVGSLVVRRRTGNNENVELRGILYRGLGTNCSAVPCGIDEQDGDIPGWRHERRP